MSNLQPENIKAQSYAQRARLAWRRLIEPHPSIKEIGEFRRAQLLAILTLILSLLIIIGLFSTPKTIGAFLVLGTITLVSFVLSKTKYYRLGTYFFTYAFTAIGFVRIYQGSASSVESSIASTVHIALIFSSVLLSQRGFLSLAVLSSIAAFAAPLYSKSPYVETGNLSLTGGIVLTIGAILYGIQIFRANLDKEKLKEVTDANRELEDLTTNLEQRIGARTLELEMANQQVLERATRLQLISEISKEISSVINQKPKELLNRITISISEKLGFYHVGIFLLDENRDFVVLQAANSEGGQRMLNRHHQLKVGTGIVGYVSQSGHPRIALDTGDDSVFFRNPDLPKTRSEIALPLKYGENLIGVLDVQSTLNSEFDEEDTNTLSTLANQVAIIIYSVIFKERMDTGRPLRDIKERGEKLGSQKMQSGYSYLPDGSITNANLESNSSVDRVIASGETAILTLPTKGNPSILAVPVKFRERVIGIIQIEAAEANRKWTEDEIALIQSISDRAAYALDNARLFEETSSRAERERLVTDITTKIRGTNDPQEMINTAVEELKRALGATRVEVVSNRNILPPDN